MQNRRVTQSCSHSRNSNHKKSRKSDHSRITQKKTQQKKTREIEENQSRKDIKVKVLQVQNLPPKNEAGGDDIERTTLWFFLPQRFCFLLFRICKYLHTNSMRKCICSRTTNVCARNSTFDHGKDYFVEGTCIVRRIFMRSTLRSKPPKIREADEKHTHKTQNTRMINLPLTKKHII